MRRDGGTKGKACPDAPNPYDGGHPNITLPHTVGHVTGEPVMTLIRDLRKSTLAF